ncbi:cullin-4B [Westerdykella ornata]|uniref:Cullin-4B n=1 Tax=Westerdykella ornata TaxID=318751 RepID=A0A6A6J7Z5_WESOR|nr:cullin-4B [Westerdykella ornata]KAF2272681.1 cullin-4B [Westerdykella ornata]
MSPKRKHAEKTTNPELLRPASPGSSPTTSSKRLRLEQEDEHEQLEIKTAVAMYSFPSKKKADIKDPATASPAGAPRNGFKAAPTMQANGGPKRMLVKNFRPARKVDTQAFLKQTWQNIEGALDTVFAGGKTDFSLEELYRGVENLCRQGMGKETCQILLEKCEKHVFGTLGGRVKETKGLKDVDVLRATLHAWATWMEQLRYIEWIFCYLDRSYLLPERRSLRGLAIDLFKNGIFRDPELERRIIDGACELISVDREGKDMDRETFQKAIDMFHLLGVYTKYFEPRMLQLSQEYIHAWAERESTQQDLATYVKEATELMEREMDRVQKFNLDGSTRRDLLTLLEDLLISGREDRLTNADDIADLLEDNSIEDLKRLYRLLERRKRGTSLRPAFTKWIEDTGTAIVFDEKEQDDMVVKLLTLKRQLDHIWKVSFMRNQELGHAMRECFEAFMNKTKKSASTWGTDNSKPAEMIAKYVDKLLRGGAKAIPAKLIRKTAEPAAPEADAEEDNEDMALDEDAEVNNQLDQVLDLFRFVHGKATFEAFYKNDLSRRLLMGRSASADAERSMLARLKTECGAGFTANLEQMFKDVELSREEMSSYKSILEERGEKQALDLNVNILSSSAWPTYPTIPVIIPPHIKSVIDRFEAHYKSKHSNRKLDWKHHLAHCQVKANFPQGRKELIVSSFQAIVLLLFNGVKLDEHLDYNYIKEATGLPPAELNRTLQSLACAKLRPLTKHPKSRDISPTDTFTLNASFTDPKYRIKINTVQLKETQQENKETHERVAADRNYETQAAIVRILKARKKIGHNELVAETIRVTKERGTLDVAGIKRNIEKLIEKEFLEREEDGGYSYVA